MSRIAVVLATAVVLFCLSLAAPAQARTIHVVSSGETLSAIAQRHYGDRFAYRRIAQASGISNPNRIYPGQVLTIPDPSEPQTVRRTARVVRAGRNVTSALRYRNLSGTDAVPASLVRSSENLGGRTVLMKVTAYCNCQQCTEKRVHDGKTATGANAFRYEGVASDLTLLPSKTRLFIPGVGVKHVDDTGGAMRQAARKGIYHIDVRLPSHAQARRLGVRWLKVVILGRN